jgi:hypothetical protein
MDDEAISRKINLLDNEYDNNISVILGRIPNERIIVFVSIFTVALYLAKKIEVHMSVVFFLILGLVAAYLVQSKDSIENLTYDRQLEIKLELIRPRPKRIDNYPDLIDFLYSIRDFYLVNPNAFYSMVENIDNFAQIYNQMTNNQVLYLSQNYDIAEEFARTAQNNLHSIIYNLNADHRVTKKYHKSLKELHFILRQYMGRLIKICNNQFNTDELNINSRLVKDSGPHASNFYANENTLPSSYFSGTAESKFQFF